MTTAFSFGRAEAALTRAAHTGAREAAEVLADGLRADGEQASVQSAPDGTARVVLEGAGAVAREFGTRTIPARPVLGPALQAKRGRIGEVLSGAVTGALKGRP